MKDTDAAYIAGIIDGEGTITLTRMHTKENRRPVISIASTDLELLDHIKGVTGGTITKKRNYSPMHHKNSFTITLKSKECVINTLKQVLPYLRVPLKIRRAKFILDNYNNVTPRNGKYNSETLKLKKQFEDDFFDL